MNTPQEIATFCKRHEKVIDKIAIALWETNTSAQDGEAILLWCAGISAGIRQVSMTDNWVLPAVRGWQAAVQHSDDEEPQV